MDAKLKNYKIKEFILVILFLLFPKLIFCQTEIGIKSGANLTRMKSTFHGTHNTMDYILTYHGGVYLDISLFEHLSIQSNILLSIKGGKESFNGITGKVVPIYVDVPFYLLGKVKIKKVKIYGGVGYYFGYGIGGRSYREGGGETFSSQIKWGNDTYNTDLNHLDQGYTATLGVGLTPKLSFSVSYEEGFYNIFPKGNSWNRIINKTFYLSIIYSLKKKKEKEGKI